MDFDNLMQMAMDRIKPYLPDMYEMDDCSWGEGFFQICVFDCRKPGLSSPVDRFRFRRYAGETDDEVMKRFDNEVDNYTTGWGSCE